LGKEKATRVRLEGTNGNRKNRKAYPKNRAGGFCAGAGGRRREKRKDLFTSTHSTGGRKRKTKTLGQAVSKNKRKKNRKGGIILTEIYSPRKNGGSSHQ